MSFQDPIECYQAIAEELAEIVPEQWLQIDVLATRYEDSINLEIVYVRPDGSKESDVDPIRIDEYFFELADLVSTPEKGLYRSCTFHLEPSGDFKVDFVY